MLENGANSSDNNVSDLILKLTRQPNTFVSHVHVTTVTLWLETSGDDACAVLCTQNWLFFL